MDVIYNFGRIINETYQVSLKIINYLSLHLRAIRAKLILLMSEYDN